MSQKRFQRAVSHYQASGSRLVCEKSRQGLQFWDSALRVYGSEQGAWAASCPASCGRLSLQLQLQLPELYTSMCAPDAVQTLLSVDELRRRGCDESAADLLLTLHCLPASLQTPVGEAAYMLARSVTLQTHLPLHTIALAIVCASHFATARRHSLC
jgi:hypothetical protein